ncbi:MAG: SpoIIE family protein phosphatase [Thermodesulfobacteriota bacterium]
MTRNSLTFKLALLVLAFSTLILGAVLTTTYLFSRSLIIEQAEENSHIRGREVANLLASLIKPIEQSGDNIGLVLEDADISGIKLENLTHHVVSNNPRLFGMAIAFEPFVHSRDKLFFAPYSYRKDGEMAVTQLGSSDYRYFYKDWYQLPRELGHAVWTEPYFDHDGCEALIASYAVPFYRRQGKAHIFAGVIRADISLDWLQELISSIKLYDSGYAAMISRNGTFIYHPVGELMFNETIFSLAEELGDEELWRIGRDMISGRTGFIQRDSVRDHRPSFLLHMPLPLDGWSLAFLFPVDEVLRDTRALTRSSLITGLLGFVIFTLVISASVRRMISPLGKLSKGAMEIADGNLHAELPAPVSKDEIGQLTESFGQMQESLQSYIENLKRTTTEKERIESELRIAHDIQMGILPKTFPPFPDRVEFDIFASLVPAREVGGDLYDFFFIDENQFCFLIGDVSGKGVPAAFLMAVTKTLLKTVATEGFKPGQILEKVNNDLAEDNEACMFVTLFLAILDTRSGELSYASAGHNPPLVISSAKGEFLPSLHEPVAGAMEGMGYSTVKMTLEPNDMVFLYTDGVTEAMNEDEELYSDKKLLNLVNEKQYNSSQELIQTVAGSVATFAGRAEQSDDITMLGVRYTGEQR